MYKIKNSEHYDYLKKFSNLKECFQDIINNTESKGRQLMELRIEFTCKFNEDIAAIDLEDLEDLEQNLVNVKKETNDNLLHLLKYRYLIYLIKYLHRIHIDPNETKEFKLTRFRISGFIRRGMNYITRALVDIVRSPIMVIKLVMTLINGSTKYLEDSDSIKPAQLDPNNIAKAMITEVSTIIAKNSPKHLENEPINVAIDLLISCYEGMDNSMPITKNPDLSINASFNLFEHFKTMRRFDSIKSDYYTKYGDPDPDGTRRHPLRHKPFWKFWGGKSRRKHRCKNRTCKSRKNKVVGRRK
jgi:hypothetical protein